MQITWKGVSCVLLGVSAGKQEQIRIVIDPYQDSVGLKLPSLEADILLVSKDDQDHNNASAVKGDPFLISNPGEYDVKGVFIQGVSSVGDKLHNTIYIIEAEGMRLCHLGGLSQKGEYKIDCRFNKEELISKIKFIAIHKKQIHIKNMDALELVRKTAKDKNTLFYFDPPYYLKGPSLYMSHYQHDDHRKVSREIKKIKNAKWIVSYDNTPEIKDMYQGCRKKEYSFFHTAYNARVGKEILFFSNGLKYLPGRN